LLFLLFLFLFALFIDLLTDKVRFLGGSGNERWSRFDHLKWTSGKAIMQYGALCCSYYVQIDPGLALVSRFVLLFCCFFGPIYRPID